MNLNQLFPRLSIRAKLAIAFAGLAIAPALALTVLGVRSASRHSESLALATLEHDVDEARDKTQHILSDIEADLSFLTRTTLGPRLLEGDGADWGAAGVEMTTLLQLKPVLHQIKVVTAAGDLPFAADARGAKAPRADEGVYYSVVARSLFPGRHAVLPVELLASEEPGGTLPAMALVEAVYDGGGALRGAVVIEARAHDLFANLEEGSPGLAGVTGLIGPDGFMLYHSERKADWSRLLATRTQLELDREVSEEMAVRIRDADRAASLSLPDDRILSYAPLQLLDAGAVPLVLYRIVPAGVLREEIQSFLGLTAMSGVVAVAVVLALAVLASHQLTQPIYRLRAAARRLAAGQSPGPPLRIQTRDELEDLAEDFSTMAAALVQEREGLESLVQERTRALGEALAELQGILNHSADAIVGLDVDRRVRVWSDGSVSLFGYEANEAVGQQIDALLLPTGPRWKREADFIWREVEARGALTNFQTRRARCDGDSCPVSLTLSVIRGQGGEVFGYSLILRDTALQIRLEEQMRRSERLAALSVMAGGLAHELGNPLAIIENRIECMQREIDGLEGAGPLASDLEVLSQHAGRLQGLVEGFLGFARDEQFDTGLVDVNELGRRIASLLDRTYRSRSVTLDLDLEEGLPQVSGNAKAIETVCMNLLLNALDATPESGRVTLRTRRAGDARGVELVVTDSGAGIPGALQHRIFEPFFTTKQEAGGTGLGLAVCRAVMERHGGSIRLTSEPGTGAEFTLRFPEPRFEIEWLKAESS